MKSRLWRRLVPVVAAALGCVASRDPGAGAPGVTGTGGGPGAGGGAASGGGPGTGGTAATADASPPAAKDAADEPARPDAADGVLRSDAAPEALPLRDAGPSPRGSILVYAASSTGPIKYGGIGWLYGLSETNTIPDDRISGLGHPQYTGQMAPGGKQHPDGDALKVVAQFRRAGGRGISVYVQDYDSAWPYRNDGIDSYISNVVDRVTTAVKADPNRTFMHYVPFNEPDWIWYGPSGTKLTQFLNDWKRVYDRIKANDPGATIAGPSFEAYSAAAYDSFVSFAKTNDCLPDIVTWHELNDGPAKFYANYASYRSIEARYGLAPREVFINEYGRQTGEMARPGKMIQYLARFESTKVYGGMAAWSVIGRLSDLLATDGRPAGGWYLYQWYGQQTGNTVQAVLPDQNGALQAMGFRDASGAVSVIFGGSAGDADVFNLDVVITDLPGASVRFEVRETNHTGATYQAPPGVKSSGTAAVTGGQARITVTGCKALSAYLVKVTP